MSGLCSGGVTKFDECPLAVLIVFDRVKMKSRGYGFVLFFDAASAARVLQNPVHLIDGRETLVVLISLSFSNSLRMICY